MKPSPCERCGFRRMSRTQFRKLENSLELAQFMLEDDANAVPNRKLSRNIHSVARDVYTVEVFLRVMSCTTRMDVES